MPAKRQVKAKKTSAGKNKARATTKGKGKGKAAVPRRRSVRKNVSQKCAKCNTSMSANTPDKCACKYLVGAKRTGKDGKSEYVVKTNAKNKLFWSVVTAAKKKAAPKKKRAAPARRLSAPGEHKELLATSEKRAQFTSALKMFKDPIKSNDYKMMEQKFIKSDHAVIHTVVMKLGKLIKKKLELLKSMLPLEIMIEMKGGAKVWNGDNMNVIASTEGSAKTMISHFLQVFTKYSEFNAFYNNFFRALKKSGSLFQNSSGETVEYAPSAGDNIHDFLAKKTKEPSPIIKELVF